MRPEHLALVPQGRGMLTGRVQISEYTGSGSLLHVEVAGAGAFLVLSEGQDGPGPDDTVHLSIAPAHVHLFDAEGLALRRDHAAVDA